MGATTGIVALGTYGSDSVDENIDELLALLADPDSDSSSGAQAGGGLLDEMSPAALAQLRVELEAIKGSTAGGGASGQHIVTADEATAGIVNIVTGLTGIALGDVSVTVTRAGVVVTDDAVISEPVDGTIRVADGVTYNTTAGDKVNWAVVA